MKKYRVLLTDPPWPGNPTLKKDKNSGKLGRPHSPFPLMSHAAIRAMPVKDIMMDDSMIFMWTIGRSLGHAIDIMEAWGFVYKSLAFVWIKPTKNGKYVQGMGYWTRQNAEICLLGTRGSPMKFAVPNNKRPSVPSIICEPRRELVRKPDCVRDRILTLTGDVPRLEMFARTVPKGWDVYGNEVKSAVKISDHKKISSTIAREK